MKYNVNSKETTVVVTPGSVFQSVGYESYYLIVDEGRKIGSLLDIDKIADKNPVIMVKLKTGELTWERRETLQDVTVYRMVELA